MYWRFGRSQNHAQSHLAIDFAPKPFPFRKNLMFNLWTWGPTRLGDPPQGTPHIQHKECSWMWTKSVWVHGPEGIPQDMNVYEHAQRTKTQWPTLSVMWNCVARPPTSVVFLRHLGWPWTPTTPTNSNSTLSARFTPSPSGPPTECSDWASSWRG